MADKQDFCRQKLYFSVFFIYFQIVHMSSMVLKCFKILAENILRRPQKFEKNNSHFFNIYLVKKVGDFFSNFTGIARTSEISKNTPCKVSKKDALINIV